MWKYKIIILRALWHWSIFRLIKKMVKFAIPNIKHYNNHHAYSIIFCSKKWFYEREVVIVIETKNLKICVHLKNNNLYNLYFNMLIGNKLSKIFITPFLYLCTLTRKKMKNYLYKSSSHTNKDWNLIPGTTVRALTRYPFNYKRRLLSP